MRLDGYNIGFCFCFFASEKTEKSPPTCGLGWVCCMRRHADRVQYFLSIERTDKLSDWKETTHILFSRDLNTLLGGVISTIKNTYLRGLLESH
jgi:hypothetical protein